MILHAKMLAKFGLSGLFLYCLAVALFHVLMSLINADELAPLIAACVALCLAPLAWFVQYRFTFNLGLSLRAFIVYLSTQLPLLLFVGPALTWAFQLLGCHPTLAFSGAVIVRSVGSYFLFRTIRT